MSLEKTFCSSPWFHMRINNSGTYEPCRWMSKMSNTRVDMARNIKNMSPQMYFQTGMAPLRAELLQGHAPAMCKDCHVMEQHGKPSGRQRQLLKVGVMPEHFEKSLASSPMRESFDHSNSNQGHTDHAVTDWQIDLGNYCNGACVFCHPESSSTLATEFKKLGLIDQLPPPAWCDDPVLLDRFVDNLVGSANPQYLHFLGGETVITPGFKRILTALINADLAKQITIGFTTNLTVWSDSVVELLKQFRLVNLGMSIETLTAVNDYVRYPSQQMDTKKILDRWVAVATQQDWLIQLRVTPNCLTLHDLTTVYDYAWHNNISVESCNFLSRPEFLRIGVLPDMIRKKIANQLKIWIDNHAVLDGAKIVNTRDPNMAQVQIVQDALSYLNYLESAPDESDRLPELISYLKLLESSRGNSILTYLPEYEDLFRANGY